MTGKEPEDRLFEEAMRGVEPVGEDAKGPPRRRRPAARPAGERAAKEPHGRARAHPEIPASRRAGRGVAGVDGQVDLHGLTAEEARREVRGAVAHARAAGWISLLLIHGRGLGSPGPPVLAAAVRRELTEPALRGAVRSFAPAPSAFGGEGATLVLLRRTSERPPPPASAPPRGRR